uniref:Bestrophin homolog n=1 Tax=Timema monikensis TaxID=170555 RepID=A0A7R9E2W0_9NEOP|nr:unnamed protein product [Timema monikensis]
MTISYSGEVANSSNLGCFWKILCKWKGSVYKLIWRDLLAYLCLYFAISLAYRFALSDDQKRTFEKIRLYASQQSESIPMSFVLGFYVSLIVKRWWEQYRLLPWPDSLALFVSAAIPGSEERGRLMRRNIVRYAMLSYVITLQKVSFRVKKRFPTWQHVVDAGLMLESEKKIFDMMDEKSDMSKYWMPLIWATNIINRARKENLIASDHLVQTMLMELSDIRRRLGSLIGYDTVCVPLVYTQFFFYIGWLKVAEVLINPFGEDDDDIELNWLIDRHIKAAYMIVDEMHEEHPELLKDQYWDEVVPKDLPYTVASEIYRRSEPKGSAEMFLQIKPADSMYANLMPQRKSTVDDMYADYESVDTPLVERRKNWFQRQLTRMGSSRSSITTYSTGPFGPRGRHNSVYSSPDVPIPQHPPHPHLLHKASLYDRLVGRKSIRGQVRRQVAQAGRSQTGSIDRPVGKDHLTHMCSAMWSVEGGKEEQTNELVRQKKVISLVYVSVARHWPDRVGLTNIYRIRGSMLLLEDRFLKCGPRPLKILGVAENMDKRICILNELPRFGGSTNFPRWGPSFSPYFGEVCPRGSAKESTRDGGAPRESLAGASGRVILTEDLSLDRLDVLLDWCTDIGEIGVRILVDSTEGTGKMNGSAVPGNLKNRPRIPTPDVTKEVVDREQRLAMSGNILTPGALLSHQIHSGGSPYHHNHHAEPPVVQVVLSPIQELESGGSISPTTPPMVAHQIGGASHLAQSILSQSLSTVGMGASPSNTTMLATAAPLNMATMTLTPIAFTAGAVPPGSSPSLPPRHLHLQIQTPPHQPATLTEVDEQNGGTSEDRSRKTSTASQTKRSEVYV